VACYALEMTLYLAHINRGAKQHYPASPSLCLGLDPGGSLRRRRTRARPPRPRFLDRCRFICAMLPHFLSGRWVRRLRVRLAIHFGEAVPPIAPATA
jgi:hypothetical protein